MSWFKRPWTLDVCYFGDFLTDCTRVNHECISHHHLGESFVGSLVPSTSKTQIFKQLFTHNFLAEVYVAFDRGLPIHVWVRASKKENGPNLWWFLLAKRRRESPKKTTTKTKGLYGSPIVYFERTPPKTSPVPAVRFRGCTTEMCCPKNQSWSQNLMVWRSQKPYKESKPSIGAG